MRDFLRRALSLVIVEALIFVPFLWSEDVGREVSSRQVHGFSASGGLEREREPEDSEGFVSELEPGDEGGLVEGSEDALAGEGVDEGDLLLASALVDERGGVLEKGALRLHIPPGALLEPMEISIYG